MASKTERDIESQAPALITSLPEDVMIDILARVPRREYPTLSLVSKYFRSLVASPGLYVRRSVLGFTEHCFYSSMTTNHVTTVGILHRKANGKRSLVLIHSLPAKKLDATILSVGSSIYVFGGGRDGFLRIDCGLRTVEHLPNMPLHMSHKIADIIDGRIYVIGNNYDSMKKKKAMVVFNTEAKMWEPGMILRPNIDLGETLYGCVAMADKMYTTDKNKSFVYKPKEGIWETDEMLSSKTWRDACVVDDVLYYYDTDALQLRTYDSKRRCWGVVEGLKNLLHITLWSDWIGTTSCETVPCPIKSTLNKSNHLKSSALETDKTLLLHCLFRNGETEVESSESESSLAPNVWMSLLFINQIVSWSSFMDKYIYTCKNPPFSHYNAVAIEQ
ncbi:unnamed protein product [Brassica oleracea var. botrytis]